jgi:hypothetical protein
VERPTKKGRPLLPEYKPRKECKQRTFRWLDIEERKQLRMAADENFGCFHFFTGIPPIPLDLPMAGRSKVNWSTDSARTLLPQAGKPDALWRTGLETF